MNLSSSQVQSSAKCGSSDFSIEKILSEDSKSAGERQIPSWLCCTRYQPPRLPRAASTCRARRSGRHARVPFTSTQASALEAAYTRAQYLAPPALRALASALQLREDRIKIWFQNRRARERREKSGTITPPQAVVLPSTAPFQRNILNEVWSQSDPHSYDIEHTQSTTNLDNSLSTSVSNNTCLIPSLIYMSEEDSNNSRSNTPLDVETITD